VSSLPQPSAAGPQPVEFRILRDERFVRYAWAKFLSLTGQDALIYGLFIAVITRQDSSLATSAFVLASVVPSILLSLPGGLFADWTPNKFGLLSTMLVRLAIVYLFFDLGPGVEGVIALTFLVWTVYQFFSPSESAAVLALVPRERLAQASSLVQAISLVASLAGAGLIAPLAVRLLEENGLYIIVFILFSFSFVLFASIPDLSAEQEREAKRLSPWRALPVGWRTIRNDSRLTSITLFRVIQDTGMLALVVVAPVFIEDTLGASAATTVYIAVPGAAGIASGLLIAPVLLTMMPARALALAGFVMFTSVLLILPFVDTVAPELTQTLGPFRELQDLVNLSDAIVATMMLLPIGGLGVSFVQVSSRTEVYRRAPPAVLAQVFSTQSAIASVAALAPTFLVGLMLDLVPVRAVLAFVGISLTALAIAAWLKGVGADRTQAMDGAAGSPPTLPSFDNRQINRDEDEF
jgi:predicted MFS family arabinose efflux permease